MRRNKVHWQFAGNLRRLVQDIDDRKAIFHVHGHEDARHDGKVKCHVALVAVAEIGDGFFRPLIGLGEQHAIAIFLIHMAAQLFQELMGFRQIFAACPFPLE